MNTQDIIHEYLDEPDEDSLYDLPIEDQLEFLKIYNNALDNDYE